ncbi:hypothetical protein JCGZ_20490 [Jatropha curcas]|uniref:DUF7722 domain-containing protein n=1 Tax=Jatropha curcas TaxID=180498 RepID=A0A067K0L0_JATCU|nr:hypothetical protein JCGZ_20490 [Jatropha curcas]
MSGTIFSNTAAAGFKPNGHQNQETKKTENCFFRMPLHYPRFKKSDYQNMPEWKLDCLLKEYGLPVMGDVDEKRKFAMGAFLWPSEME